MAAVIDLTGATSAEGQLLQLLYALNNLENANVDSDGNANTDNIQITPNAETGIVGVALSLPINATSTANGVTYSAKDFL